MSPVIASAGANVCARVNAIGKGRIVLAGLWTSVCIVSPALSDSDMIA